MNVVGHFGRQNFGDALMGAGLSAIANDIGLELVYLHKQRIGRAAGEMDPVCNRGHYRWSIGGLRALLSGDTVLCGGTNIHDEFRRIRAVRHFVAMTLLIGQLGLTRLAGHKAIALAIGHGPIRRRSTRLISRTLEMVATSVSVRDEDALDAFEKQRQDRRDGPEILPDLAFAARWPAQTYVGRSTDLLVAPTRSLQGERIVPAPHALAAAAVKSGLERSSRITVVAFNAAGPDTDVPAAAAHANALEERGFSPRLAVPVTTSESLEELRRARIVVASRFHAVLAAHRLGCSTIAVPYHPKVRGLSNQWGIALWEPGADVNDLTRLLRADGTPRVIVPECERAQKELADWLQGSLRGRSR